MAVVKAAVFFVLGVGACSIYFLKTGFLNDPAVFLYQSAGPFTDRLAASREDISLYYLINTRTGEIEALRWIFNSSDRSTTIRWEEPYDGGVSVKRLWDLDADGRKELVRYAPNFAIEYIDRDYHVQSRPQDEISTTDIVRIREKVNGTPVIEVVNSTGMVLQAYTWNRDAGVLPSPVPLPATE